MGAVQGVYDSNNELAIQDLQTMGGDMPGSFKRTWVAKILHSQQPGLKDGTRVAVKTIKRDVIRRFAMAWSLSEDATLRRMVEDEERSMQFMTKRCDSFNKACEEAGLRLYVRPARRLVGVFHYIDGKHTFGWQGLANKAACDTLGISEFELGNGTRAVCEELLPDFAKWNNNDGNVINSGVEIAHALCHHVWVRTGHACMYLDAQGYHGPIKHKGTTVEGLVLSDPALSIHDDAGPEWVRDSTNQGTNAHRRFFSQHTCGPICKRLGLHKHRISGTSGVVRPSTAYIATVGVFRGK